MFEYAFMRNALAVAMLVGLVFPVIGACGVLRRYTMIVDAM